MSPQSAKLSRWVGRFLFATSLVACFVGWSTIAATSETHRWTHAVQFIGGVCALLWWVPGVVGVAMLFATRR